MKKEKKDTQFVLSKAWQFAKENWYLVLPCSVFVFFALVATSTYALGVDAWYLAMGGIEQVEIRAAIALTVACGILFGFAWWFSVCAIDIAGTLFCEMKGYRPRCYEITEKKGNFVYVREASDKKRWEVFGKRKAFWWLRK